MIPAVCSMGGLHLHIDFISCHKAFPLEIWKCHEMSRNPIHFIIMRQLCGVVWHDNYIFDGCEPTYIIYIYITTAKLWIFECNHFVSMSFQQFFFVILKLFSKSLVHLPANQFRDARFDGLRPTELAAHWLRIAARHTSSVAAQPAASLLAT